ncbi:hypothetical protein GF324_08440 [bacterium]|nr:hypothetical protein [bacterium]
MKWHRGFLFLIPILYGAAVPVSADIVSIPTQFNNLSEALWVLSERDTVIYEPGMYAESASVQGLPLTIASRFLLEKDSSLIATTRISYPGSEMAMRSKSIMSARIHCDW